MTKYCVGALVLLTALLCITWCDALSCRKCDRSRCKPLTLRDCPNGIGRDVCGCCDRCLKGLGEECGGLWNLKGSCGKKFTCEGSTRNRPGKCVRKLKPGQCPEGIACIALYKPPPKGCKYGYSKPACGCFASCNRGPGDSCGYKTSQCLSGYYCKGQRYIKDGRRFKYINGVCTRKTSTGGCPYRLRCNRKRCPKLSCTYGSAKPLCNCCTRCTAGIGGACGLNQAVCRKGFYCRGASVRVVDGWPKYTTGKCYPKRGFTGCWKKRNCRLVRCGRPNGCKNGIGKSACGCCQRCLAGLNESCGVRDPKDPPCAKGLRCVGERLSGLRYTAGRCVRIQAPGTCPFKINCPVYIRAPDPPTGCRYGYSKPRCGCLDKCNRGANQSCGYKTGNCRSGYDCRGQRVRRLRGGKLVFTKGRCVRRGGGSSGSCPCRRPCPRILCRTPRNCKYGYEKAKCGCCPECRKDDGEKCGPRRGVCRSGFYCQGSSLSKDSRGRCIFRSGTCRPRTRPQRCPRPVPCTKIFRPPPTNCRYGYSRIICGCGKACNKGSGERCGFQIGNCRSGYFCRGQRYIRRGDSIKYINGRCTKKGNTSPPKCYRKQNCAVVSCVVPPTNCKYGVGRSPCGCCSQCLKGPGDECGNANSKYLPCGRGLQCYGERFTRYYRPGRCFGKNIPERFCRCPRRQCRCKIPKCKYGASIPRCGCCNKCRRGLHQKCGDGIANCRAGLYCSYKQRVASKDKTGKCYRQVGRCERRIGRCPYPVLCPQYLVAPRPPRGCRYGYSKPRCGCKPKCDKGINEKCGYKIGNCRIGYYCSGRRARKVDGKVKYTAGYCRKIGGCSWYLNCRNRRCPRLRHCKYGSSKPRCGCCTKCKRGLNGKCGYSIADCRKGYYCRGQRVKQVNGRPVFTPGKCTKFGTRFCPYKIKCSKRRTYCGSCRYGSSKPICGCNRVCNKNINEKCGYRIGNCRDGHYCRGMRVRKVSGKIKYTPGRCRKRGGCSYFLDCTNCECPKRKCKYGATKPRCSCCKKCRVGEYGKCGQATGDCRKGMYCRGQKVKEVNGKPVFTPGICIKYGGCPYRIRCRRIACPKYKCRYGIAKPRCGCCPICRRGENRTCGIKHGQCRFGYYCRGDSVKVVDGRPVFTPGKCIKRRTGKCPCLVPCPKIRCRTPRDCRWGYERSACGCCPTCRKGPGEICGDRVGVCRSGYFCKGKRTWRPNNSRSCKFQTGVCTRSNTSSGGGRCVIAIRCPAVRRPPPSNCKFGYSKPVCACFPRCRRDAGEKCGYRTAECRKGLVCVGRSMKKGDGSGIFRDGVCRSRSTGGCPYRIICNKRACPRYRCRYGIAKPKCGCCPVCKRGINGRCGIRDGSCRRGYRCVGDRVRVVNGRPVFTAGKCRPKGRKPRCRYPVACPLIFKPPPKGCKYGFSRPVCACFAVCRRGANQPCGYNLADCRKGLRCYGRRVRKINGRIRYTNGRCRSRRSRCPYSIRCNRRRCRRLRCRYGIAKPRCACCPVCRKGRNGRCGIRDGLCRRGYRCVGSRVRVVHGRPIFTAGRCRRPRSNRRCPYRIICNRRACPRYKCQFGIAKPRCACCPVCRKGQNGKCGIKDGLCRRGYRCVGARVRVVRGRPIFTAGRCTSRTFGKCLFPFVCPAVIKPPPRNCRFGYSKPACACFAVCRKGDHEACGLNLAECRKGSYCSGQRVRARDGRAVFTNGICRRSRRPIYPPVRPPRPPVYPPIRPPRPPVHPPIRPPRPPVFPPFYPPIRPPRPPIHPPIRPPRPPVRPPRPEVCEPGFPPIDVPTPRVWGRRPVYRPDPPQRFFPALPPRRRVSQPKPFPYLPRRPIQFPRPRPFSPRFPPPRRFAPVFRKPRRRPYGGRRYHYGRYPRCNRRAGQSCDRLFGRYGCCQRGLYCKKTCRSGRGVCVYARNCY